MSSHRHPAMTALCRIILTGSEITKHWSTRHLLCENRHVHLMARDTHHRRRRRLARLALSIMVVLIGKHPLMNNRTKTNMICLCLKINRPFRPIGGSKIMNV
jgi:hypothetical protein